jgi:hypothetical protein
MDLKLAVTAALVAVDAAAVTGLCLRSSVLPRQGVGRGLAGVVGEWREVASLRAFHRICLSAKPLPSRTFGPLLGHA